MKSHKKERVREYQSTKLDRVNEDNLVLELMPLPSLGTKEEEWKYNQFTDKPELKSRKNYSEWRDLLQNRIKKFQQLYKDFLPKMVIAYGKGQWTNYKKILMAGQGKKVKLIKLDNIAEIFGNIILVRHPDTRGIKNDEFEFVGHWVRNYGEFNFDRDFPID